MTEILEVTGARSAGGSGPRAEGLDGLVVADTALSEVDGDRGRLIVAGYDIEELAGRVSFEALVGLLLRGSLPAPSEVTAIAAALARARQAAFERLPSLSSALGIEDGVDALRAALSHHSVPAAWSEDRAIELCGAVPVYAGAWAMRRRGMAPVAPRAGADHASDALSMMTGGPCSEARARALGAYLVTVADHGMNASTFTARVVASTGSDLASAVVAALGALKGPLHGGAPGPVLDMLDAIGRPERARAFLEAELAAGRRIMGMGHRVYRVRDPRAEVLERATRALGGDGDAACLALAREVEVAAESLLAERHPDRALRANVEFYTAVLLRAVGLSPALFTLAFAAGRTLGWAAHFKEQQAVGRLIRPKSRYVGPRPAGK